jgi:hypothetical protein
VQSVLAKRWIAFIFRNLNSFLLQAVALTKGKPFPDIDLLIALSAKSVSELLSLDENHLKMCDSLKSKGIRLVGLVEVIATENSGRWPKKHTRKSHLPNVYFKSMSGYYPSSNTLLKNNWGNPSLTLIECTPKEGTHSPHTSNFRPPDYRGLRA